MNEVTQGLGSKPSEATSTKKYAEVKVYLNAIVPFVRALIEEGHDVYVQFREDCYYVYFDLK